MQEKIHTDKNKVNTGSTMEIALTGLLLAAAIVLSVFESSLPPVMAAVPGVKFGLSNVAVMYALFFLNRRQAVSVAVLKSLFVLFTRGPMSGVLSLAGGLLSIFVMLLLMKLLKDRISYLMLSIAGAVFHNIGQLAAVAVMLSGIYMMAYLPVLLVSGVAAGAATATLLKFIMPAFQRMR